MARSTHTVFNQSTPFADVFGLLPAGVDLNAILTRAAPAE